MVKEQQSFTLAAPAQRIAIAHDVPALLAQLVIGVLDQIGPLIAKRSCPVAYHPVIGHQPQFVHQPGRAIALIFLHLVQVMPPHAHDILTRTRFPKHHGATIQFSVWPHNRPQHTPELDARNWFQKISFPGDCIGKQSDPRHNKTPLWLTTNPSPSTVPRLFSITRPFHPPPCPRCHHARVSWPAKTRTSR